MRASYLRGLDVLGADTVIDAEYNAQFERVTKLADQIRSYWSPTQYEMARWLTDQQKAIDSAYRKGLVDSKTATNAMHSLGDLATKKMFGPNGDPATSEMAKIAKVDGLKAAVASLAGPGGAAVTNKIIDESAKKDKPFSMPWWGWVAIAGGSALALVFIVGPVVVPIVVAKIGRRH